MKHITKIGLFIFILASYHIACCSQSDRSQIDSPTDNMFSDVLSQQAASPNENIVSPFSLQHPDMIKSASQEIDEYILYVQDNSTQTEPIITPEEDIKDFVQFYCNPKDTNLFIVGEINGIHYEFSALSKQKYSRPTTTRRNLSKKPHPFVQKLLQEKNTHKISDSEEELTTPSPRSERPRPSKRITSHPSLNEAERAENNPTYFTTKNCLIASVTVASIMTGYLMLKNRK